MPAIVRAERTRSALASPIVVEGELWGAIMTARRERPLPAGMERRLADFTELVATAISNLQARTGRRHPPRDRDPAQRTVNEAVRVEPPAETVSV